MQNLTSLKLNIHQATSSGKNLRGTLPDQQINRGIPDRARTKSSQKIEKQTIIQTKQK